MLLTDCGTEQEVNDFIRLGTLDVWFGNYIIHSITPQFLHWWFAYYPMCDLDMDDYHENTEYFLRCGFAWYGWNARGKQ